MSQADLGVPVWRYLDADGNDRFPRRSPQGHADENALAALDAARAQETPAVTIHPPAHYQIDTSTPGWNTRYVDAVAKEHGWTRAEAQGRIADGGAG